MPADAQTEQRISAALHARAGGIVMGTSTLEKRFAEMQERGVKQAARRRRTATAGAVLAAAAAVVAVVAFAGVLTEDDVAAPPASGEPALETLVGSGFPEVETRFAVEQPVPMSLVVPEKGDVPGRWAYSVDEGSFWLGLDVSPSTGNANVTVEQVDEVYAPDRAWTEQTALVPAPTDADGWIAWVEGTGFATVSGRTDVVIDGVPATRFTVDVADALPETYLGCAPGERCLGLRPLDAIGSGFQAGFPEGSTVELTVLEAGGQPLLASALGAPETADQWLPLMRSVVDSLELG